MNETEVANPRHYYIGSMTNALEKGIKIALAMGIHARAVGSHLLDIFRKKIVEHKELHDSSITRRCVIMEVLT